MVRPATFFSIASSYSGCVAASFVPSFTPWRTSAADHEHALSLFKQHAELSGKGSKRVMKVESSATECTLVRLKIENGYMSGFGALWAAGLSVPLEYEIQPDDEVRWPPSQTTIEAAEEAKTAAKNRLADYCLTMLRILTLSLSAEKLRDKFEDGDKEQFEAAVQGALDWLKETQRAEKDESEWKEIQVASVVIPILNKVYELE